MNPLVKLATNALPGEHRFVFLAGAGVSKDAGVPTAWDLMLKTAGHLYCAEVENTDPRVNLEQWFLNSAYTSMTYARLMDQLYSTSVAQESFLRQFLQGYSVGDAHQGIAELARRGIIRAIITTNFDPYVEKALEQIGLDVQVIATDDDLRACEPLIHCKRVRVYKPHGTLERGKLKNTPRDLERLSPAFERELKRVTSEHGVIVLGYAGRDPGLMRVLRSRRSSFFPLFWVNPSEPDDELNRQLGGSAYSYIPCTGASQFIRSFLQLVDRVQMLGGVTGRRPLLSDLEQALITHARTAGSLFSEFTEKIYTEMKERPPECSKFAEGDEAIVHQIAEGLPMVVEFLSATDLAVKHLDSFALRSLYQGFGKLLTLYEPPAGFSATFRPIDFDGYKFLVNEMFIGFVALLVKAEQWAMLGFLLDDPLYVESTRNSGYQSFREVAEYLQSLEVDRKQRLNLRLLSVTAAMVKEHFETRGDWPLDFRRLAEGEYFLFLRTICHEMDLGVMRGVWPPRVSLYLREPPHYLRRCESQRYLTEFLKGVAFDKAEDFVARLDERNVLFKEWFRHGWENGPLEFYDVKRLGTLP